MAIEAEALLARLEAAVSEIHDHITTPEGMAAWNRLNDVDVAIRSALAEDTARAAEGQIPEGWKLVPSGATEAMQRAGMNKALRVSLGGGYCWLHYMADLYRTMLAAAPALPLTKEAADANR